MDDSINTGDVKLDNLINIMAKSLRFALAPSGGDFCISIRLPEFPDRVLTVANVDRDTQCEIGLAMCEGLDGALEREMGGGELVFKILGVKQKGNLVASCKKKEGVPSEALREVLLRVIDELDALGTSDEEFGSAPEEPVH
jgi:hypothetical protein